MRIGEPLKARRSDLLLPADAGIEENLFFLRVGAPKPGRRGRGKVQHARVTDELTVRLVIKLFSEMPAEQQLYPVAPATYRRRWDKLLQALSVPRAIGLTPGCLRAGGACYMYYQSMPISNILWAMRLKQIGTLEHYLQEAAAVNTLQQMKPATRQQIQRIAKFYPIYANHFLFSCSAQIDT